MTLLWKYSSCFNNLNKFKSSLNEPEFITKGRRLMHVSYKSTQRENLKYLEEPEDYSKTKFTTNINLSNVKFFLDDGNILEFNTTWLRDSCYQYSHKSSRQRLFIPKDFRKQLFVIKKVELLPDVKDDEILNRLPSIQSFYTGKGDKRIIQIDWSDDHTSFYRLDWLMSINEMYKNNRLLTDENLKKDDFKFEFPDDDYYNPKQNYKYPLKLWNVPILESNLSPVSFNDLCDGLSLKISDQTGQPIINQNFMKTMTQNRLAALKTLTQQLVDFGVAKIVDVPQKPGTIINVARSIAYERPTGYGVLFDVVAEASEEKNLAYSSLEFDIHVDLPYREESPGVQLLHCIYNSEVGGLSYFTDAFNAAEELNFFDPLLYKILSKYNCMFAVRDPYRDLKFRRHQPIIKLDCKGQLESIYYSPFMLPPVGHPDDVKLFYLAMDKFTQILQDKKNKYITMMQPGDLFIFNNRRVLHGRSAYDSTAKRFLQGCYMDWDEISSLREKLETLN